MSRFVPRGIFPIQDIGNFTDSWPLQTGGTAQSGLTVPGGTPSGAVPPDLSAVLDVDIKILTKPPSLRIMFAS